MPIMKGTATHGAPQDRYNIVLIILLIHGVGTLLPWNMFITANDYFANHKLNVTIGNETSATYGKNFLQYVGLASKIPNVIVQGINFLAPARERSLTVRIIISIALEAVVFALTTGLTIVDSSTWPGTFFAVTMASVVAINVANGVYQNCVFGAAAVLPRHYTNALVTGMNISGVFAALIMVCSISVAPDPGQAAFWYFFSAVVFLILCLGTYIVLTKNPLYQHYHAEATACESSAAMILPEFGKSKKTIDWTKYKLIALQCWPQLFNVFFIYVVSLALFPAVLADIKPIDGIVSKAYFSPVICFLGFNLFAMFGNLLAADILPQIPASKLWIFVVLRLLFIPFFLLCNFQPPGQERTWPVTISSDGLYTLGVVLFATTSGYFSSLAMSHAPKSVKPEHASTAGMMASFALMIGILVGVSSSFVFAKIVT